MCCLSLLCCSRLKSNRDHKRPYISPTHSILESLTWSTYIHHQSSSYIPCILLIFFCIDHPWSFVRDPGLMGCGTDQEPGDTKVTAAKLQSFRCTVSYCILLYLTVQILKDSPDLRCFGSNLARLQCCRSDFESFGDEWARAIENLVGIYYSTSPFHQPVNCELGIKVLESKKQWHSDTTTSL